MPHIDSPAAAFIAGLVTSLHCLGMCGPIACWLTPARGATDALTITVAYQLARLTAYALLGALAGLLGAQILALLNTAILAHLPWLMVAFFLAVALRLDRRLLPRIPVLNRLLLRIQTTLSRRSRLTAAAIAGIATPLLPCGPLYFLIALAAMTGSAPRGTEFMLAFGCGTLPLLWLAQANYSWLRAKISPAAINRAQTLLALVAALLIAWRLRATLGLPGPASTEFFHCH
jgi:sulfite exporter TauE/SafE